MADGRNGRQHEYRSRLQSEFAGKVAGNDGGLGACANNEGHGRVAVDADLNRHAIAAVNVELLDDGDENHARFSVGVRNDMRNNSAGEC